MEGKPFCYKPSYLIKCKANKTVYLNPSVIDGGGSEEKLLGRTLVYQVNYLIYGFMG